MNKVIILIIALFVGHSLHSQNEFPGVNYTAVYRDAIGEVLPNQSIDVRMRINTEAGSIIWEEDHMVESDDNGYFQCILGEGISTGNGIISEFSAINWGATSYSVSVSIDEGNGFVEWGINELFSVPYALYAKTAENQLYLNNLADVDTSGLSENDILKWNGLNWMVEESTDTVLFAQNSINSETSVYADTALYAFNIAEMPMLDSVLFAYFSDSSNFAQFAMYANSANSSVWSDTSLFALNSSGAWLRTGNDLSGEEPSARIGSLDSMDVKFISNDQLRMIIKANGNIGFGISNPVASFHGFNSDGFIIEGAFNEGSFPIEGGGSRLQFVPKNASFRVGRVTGNAWNESNTGDYSFAGGYNTKAQGDYSFSYGQASYSLGDHAVSMGFGANASGNTSVAMGSSPTANGVSSISLGRGTIASDTAAFAIGYHTESMGKASGAFGFQSKSNEDFSYVFGYRARANHKGCFVFSDASTYGGTQDYTTTTAENQFLVKASGGTYFYSDEDQLSGVFLASGSGSWSSLSDKNSKENIELVDYNTILEKIKAIEVFSWNYKTQNEEIRHIGPFSQDVYNAFEYGETDEAISIVDMDGINLASLKALQIKIEKLNKDLIENKDYKSKYIELLKTFEALEARIEKLESSK